MLKLIIGNKAYSSWSLRGWLACKQSGLPFEEVVVPLYNADWDQRREGDEFPPSSGKVPILWDGDTVVWDSSAIVEFLADRVGRAKFWPEDEAARGMMNHGFPTSGLAVVRFPGNLAEAAQGSGYLEAFLTPADL